MSNRRRVFLIVAVVMAMIVPTAALSAQSPSDAEITLLHTNDFHGRLETDYRFRGGSAYMAHVVNEIRSDVGAENVALLDAGDAYFAAPAISQLLMGESTIDIYNMMGYDVAALGNHEFDKGQEELADRVAQSEFPWLGANVVLEGTEWDLPPWTQPYELLEVGGITLGVLGLAGEETPTVTLLGTTDGLVFKDLTETIAHYYDEVKAQADAMVVLVHMGTADSGPYEGLETVAQNLIDADKPVDLMIGGHQHQDLSEPIYVGDTAIVAAGYYGRWLGRVDITVHPSTKTLSVDNYELITITGAPNIESMLADVHEAYEEGLIAQGVYNSLVKKLEAAQSKLLRGQTKAAENQLTALMNQLGALSAKKINPDTAAALLADTDWFLANTDFEIAARIAYWAEIVAPIVNEPVGATTIDLIRDYNDENLMGDIVTDSMRWKADEYDDGVVNGSVDIAFTNSGGLRADILIPDGASLPYTVTWGDTFEVLPFGNTLFLMDLTGTQVQEILDQSATLYKGILQTSGATWEWYNDCRCDAPTVSGAQNVIVGGVALDPSAVYRVVTNNYVAGGQDGYDTFADGTNRWDTYYDMQQGFVEYIRNLSDGVIDAVDIFTPRIVYLP